MARLHRSTLFHHALRISRAPQLASRALARLPITRHLAGGRLRYRLRSLEAFLVAEEIFRSEVYREAFAGRPIRTVVDLGCNVGYFTLYAAHRAGGEPLRALAVDGNPAMVDETRWHVAVNHLDGVEVVHGVAGFAEGVPSVTFHINASNVASSAHGTLNPNVPIKGDSRAEELPTVRVLDTWRRLHGERRIDLLKVDIEGSECDLFAHEPDLLAMTDRLVVEWHKWVTTIDEVDRALAPSGLVRCHVVGEDANAGVAIYQR